MTTFAGNSSNIINVDYITGNSVSINNIFVLNLYF